MPADEPLLTPPRYGATQSGPAARPGAARALVRAAQPRARGAGRRAVWHPPGPGTAGGAGRLGVGAGRRARASQHGAAPRPVRRAVASSLHRRHLRACRPSPLLALAPAQRKLSLSAAASVPDTGLVALLTPRRCRPRLRHGDAPDRPPQGAVSAAPPGVRAQAVARPAGDHRPVTPQLAGTRRARPQLLRSLQPDFVLPASTPASASATSVRRSTGWSRSNGWRCLFPQRTDITWDEASAAAVTGTPPRPRFELGRSRQPAHAAGDHAGARAPVAAPTPTPPRPRPPRAPPSRPPTSRRAVARGARSTPTTGGGFPDPGAEPEPEPATRIPSRSAGTRRRRRRSAPLAAAHLQRFNHVRRHPRSPFPTVELAVVTREALARTRRWRRPARVALLVDRGRPRRSRRADTRRSSTPSASPRLPATDGTAAGGDGPGPDAARARRVPPNTVVPLETNSPFVEAVLVGFNTELGRELVWREFPTPLHATYSDRFWDPAWPRPPDIPPIADWGDRLGALGGSRAGSTSASSCSCARSCCAATRTPSSTPTSRAAPTRRCRSSPARWSRTCASSASTSPPTRSATGRSSSRSSRRRPGSASRSTRCPTAGANHLPLAEGDGDAAELAMPAAPATGARHDPATVLLTRDRRWMPIRSRSVDLGPSLDRRRSTRSPSCVTELAPPTHPLALLPVRLETRFFGRAGRDQRAARPGLPRPDPHRRPRPAPQRRGGRLGPALLGAALAGRRSDAPGRAARGGCSPTASSPAGPPGSPAASSRPTPPTGRPPRRRRRPLRQAAAVSRPRRAGGGGPHARAPAGSRLAGSAPPTRAGRCSPS